MMQPELRLVERTPVSALTSGDSHGSGQKHTPDSPANPSWNRFGMVPSASALDNGPGIFIGLPVRAHRPVSVLRTSRLMQGSIHFGLSL